MENEQKIGNPSRKTDCRCLANKSIQRLHKRVPVDVFLHLLLVAFRNRDERIARNYATPDPCQSYPPLTC